MIGRLKSSLSIIFVTILSASSWYFVTQHAPSHAMDKLALSKMADVIIEGVSVRQFDNEGHLINQIEAPFVEHIPFSNQHFITSPHILIARDHKEPWEINANHAVTLDENKAIKFYEDVVIKQHGDLNKGDSTLLTSEIIYYPKKKLAETDKEVVFSQPQTTVQAKGMRAYLDENRIQLLEKARGTHAPSQG